MEAAPEEPTISLSEADTSVANKVSWTVTTTDATGFDVVVTSTDTTNFDSEVDVSINGNVVTVDSTAISGDITVKVSCKSKSTVAATKTITV